jgi:uncharacterized protein (TIGR02466 family)
MTSKLKLFPGPFLYIEEIENHIDIKNYLMPYIESSESNQHKCNDHYAKVRTSYFENSKMNEEGLKDSFSEFISKSKFLDDIVWNPLDKCLSELPFVVDHKPKKSTIDNFWFNYFERGGYHSTHVHIGSFISGIYILHLEEENPTIFLGNNNNINYYTFEYSTNKVVEGSVLLFPSQMLHFVREVNTKRVTISFNISTLFSS